MERCEATQKLSRWNRYQEVKLEEKSYLAKVTCKCNGTGIYGWACDPRHGMKFDEKTGKNIYNVRYPILCGCLEEIKEEENAEVPT